MKVKIEIDCDNAAFDGAPGAEVSRILRRLIYNGFNHYDDLEDCDGLTLMDYNGNRVGRVEVEA